MTHSYIDYSRSESPMSASYECQVPANTGGLQRFRTLQHYRRWSEAAATAMGESNEANIDSNRRWSMPTSNVSKTQSRFIPMMNKLAGLVNQPSQSSIPDQSTISDGVIEAITLLSFRAAPSKPPSQHCTQPANFQAQQHFRNQSQSQRQRQSRGELNEIVLPRANDPLYLGRYQQILENIRGESDEY